MAARRCSMCSIDYPTSVYRCHVCGEQTDWMGSAAPDPDWQHDVETRLQLSQVTEDDRINMWRLEFALSLGYSIEHAESIAVSDADLHLLERLIRAKCPLPLAARIV